MSEAEDIAAWLALDDNGVSAPTIHANAAVVFSSASMILCFFVVAMRYLVRNQTTSVAYYHLIKWLAVITFLASMVCSLWYFVAYPKYLVKILQPCTERGVLQLCSMSVVVFCLFFSTLLMAFLAVVVGTTYGVICISPCFFVCPSCVVFCAAQAADDYDDGVKYNGSVEDGDRDGLLVKDSLAKEQLEAIKRVKNGTHTPRYANKPVRRSMYFEEGGDDDEEMSIRRSVQTRRSSVNR
jgi:hypothetical protein